MSAAILSVFGEPNTDQAMNEGGWVKLYYSLLEWEWAGDPNMVALWVHLLLSANYEDKRWKGIVIRRGQFVTSLHSLTEQTGISIRSLRTCLERLKQTGEIEEKTTNRFRIITICNFGSYQAKETRTDNQPTNNRQSTDNQTTTTKEYKEYKNIISPSKEGVWVLEFFNDEIDKSGAVIPKVHKISDSSKRAGAVRARIREHGEEAVKEMIRKAAHSDFLNGRNQRGWTASFDWLFLPTNFQKVLEGNYDNHETANDNQRFFDPRQAEREQLARGYAETIARLAAEDDARASDIRKP